MNSICGRYAKNFSIGDDNDGTNMTTKFTESVVEEATLSWLAGLGYTVASGPDLAPGELFSERADYGQVVLVERLRQAIQRLNPTIPPEAREDALRKVLRIHEPALVTTNRAFHRLLTDGVDVEYPGEGGRVIGDKVWLLDFTKPENNDWLAVN